MKKIILILLIAPVLGFSQQLPDLSSLRGLEIAELKEADMPSL
jgi:hypothetical protein